MPLEHITDHDEAALARLAEQFKEKPKLAAFLSVFHRQVQEAEDAFWQLYEGRWVTSATGYVLDLLGKIVGQPRDGASDAEYRSRIVARVKANRSSGTLPELISIFSGLVPSGLFNFYVEDTTILGGPTNDYNIQRGNLSLEIHEPLPSLLVAIYQDFLRDAKAAGVHAVLRYHHGLHNDTFTTATSAPLRVAASVGHIQLLIDEQTEFYTAAPSKWPPSGTVIVDPGGTTEEETVTYSSRTPGRLNTPPLAKSHLVGAMVTLVPTVSGRGFGDSGSPGLGGELAGVVTA